MKLSRKLSLTQFTFFMFLVLLVGLIFLGGLHYMVNIQYQPPKNPFLQGPVTAKPKSLVLELSFPDDLLIFQNSEVISGKTSPNSDILISSQTSDTVIKSKADGSFSTVVNLEEGENNIEVVVFDTRGESKSETRTVYYSKEKI